MRPSKEIRWFFPGECPEGVVAWLNQTLAMSSIQAKHEERSDSYLALPSSARGLAEVGLKLRGPDNDRVEVKRLERRWIEPRRFGKDVVGWAELWIRWSFNIDANNPGKGDPTQPPGAWVVVGKARDSRQFELVDEARLVEVPFGEDVPMGGAVEVAQVEALGQTWWSIALEVFGPMETLDRTFEIVTQHVLADHPPPVALGIESSLSYPEWLEAIR